MSNSSTPHRLQPTRLLRPWDFPGKCWTVLFLIQGKKVSPEGLAVMVNGKYGKFCTTSADLTMKFIGQKVNAHDLVIEFMKYS